MTTHMESGGKPVRNVRARKAQVSTMREVMAGKGMPLVIGAGDMNLRDKEYEMYAHDDSQILDAFLEVHGEGSTEHKYTWDSQRNAQVVKYINNAPVTIRKRFDRFWVKQQGWQIDSYELVGKLPIPGELLCPSDHFGMLCSLSFKGDTDA